MKKLLHDQSGMSLATMIALGFGVAVLIVFVIGLITYLVKS